MKILHAQWGGLGTADIEEAFLAEGHAVVRFSFSKDQDVVHNQKVEKELTDSLHKEVPDVVFSFNFFPVISEVCAKEDIPYISWIFDDPCVFLYHDTAANTCNRIYVFDKELCLKFRDDGILTVHYMPLAANVERLDATDRKSNLSYEYDVSFVGSLYVEQVNFFDQMFDALTDYTKGYVHAIMAVQMQIQGCSLVESLLPPVMKDLYQAYPLGIAPGNRVTREYLYAEYVINRRLTAIERIDLLDAVSGQHPVDLFTYIQDLSMPDIRSHGIAEYYEEAPMVFKKSKVNLNITLRSIKNGIPLRAFDIMGAGGFLLSNFQSGFLDIFVPDEDFVYYENKTDLVRKVSYTI